MPPLARGHRNPDPIKHPLVVAVGMLAGSAGVVSAIGWPNRKRGLGGRSIASVTVALDHPWDSYRQVVDDWLDAVESAIPDDAENDNASRHRYFSTAALRRSRQLLVESQALLRRDPSSEGAMMLARGAFEATVLAVWLLPAPERFDQVLGEYSRNQRLLLVGSEEVLGAGFRQAMEASLPPKGPSLSMETMLRQIADWVSEVEPTFFGAPLVRLPNGHVIEKGRPPRHDGEPFRSAYGIYRHLSTNSVHGLGSLRAFVPGVEEVEHRRFEHVAVMASLLAAAVSYRNGHVGYSELLEVHDAAKAPYVVARARLNVAVNAITEEDPSIWWGLYPPDDEADDIPALEF